MVIRAFPPVTRADESGLIAVGGDLSVESLKLAYTSGIFPWPHNDFPLLWFAPPERAVLDFSDFKIPKRVGRYLKPGGFTFTVDREFAAVIRACAVTPRSAQDGTWITDDMIKGYTDFHRAGYAHSFETRNQAGHLVGGLYGVLIHRFFAAESMFHHETHASKFALIQMVNYLQQLGVTWMDIQVMTPLLAQFGATEISREVYMRRLVQTLS